MFLRAAVVALMMVPAEPIAGRQAHPHADADKLGTVNFQNSCAPEVQPTLTRAVALLHSFEFSRAIDAFTETAVKDPSCAIAYWGVAMSRWGNPFSIAIKPPAQLLPGRTAIERGRMVGAKSERERDNLERALSGLSDAGAVELHWLERPTLGALLLLFVQRGWVTGARSCISSLG